MALTEDTNNVQDVQDIILSPTRKKRFRIDGDNSRIIELNTSDMGIFARLKEEYPKLRKLSEDAAGLLHEDDESEESALNQLAELKTIDLRMRESVDAIFDSPVCAVCAPNGTLYDPFNGKFRFEYILDALTSLYENNLNQEFLAMTRRVQKHTGKYTKAKK